MESISIVYSVTTVGVIVAEKQKKSNQNQREMLAFGTIFTVFCCGTGFISCTFNGLLIWIVQQRRAGIGFYRFFTLATMLIGVAYSLALAGAQPFWFAGPGMLGFFSNAPWNGCINLIRVAYQLWFSSFVLIALCMTCSFLYRYGLLCSPMIISWFETPRRLAVILSLLLAVSVWWLCVANYLLFQVSRKVRRILHYKFSGEYSVDFMSSYVLTVDINDPFLAKYSIIGSIICSGMMLSQILIMASYSRERKNQSYLQFYCGYSIHEAVKMRVMSERMRKIHRNALKMMIIQALNPVFFLYAPSFINLFGMFVEADFGHLPKILAMSLPLFPIFNPLIVIYFTQEYKRFIFSHPSSTIQVSSTKSRDSHF